MIAGPRRRRGVEGGAAVRGRPAGGRRSLRLSSPAPALLPALALAPCSRLCPDHGRCPLPFAARPALSVLPSLASLRCSDPLPAPYLSDLAPPPKQHFKRWSRIEMIETKTSRSQSPPLVYTTPARALRRCWSSARSSRPRGHRLHKRLAREHN